MKEGRKPEQPEETPDDGFQKLPHTKARKFKSHPRLEPALVAGLESRRVDRYTTRRPVYCPQDYHSCNSKHNCSLIFRAVLTVANYGEMDREKIKKKKKKK